MYIYIYINIYSGFVGPSTNLSRDVIFVLETEHLQMEGLASAAATRPTQFDEQGGQVSVQAVVWTLKSPWGWNLPLCFNQNPTRTCIISNLCVHGND